jgi:rhodanese-related sulfurtransferase
MARDFMRAAWQQAAVMAALAALPALGSWGWRQQRGAWLVPSPPPPLITANPAPIAADASVDMVGAIDPAQARAWGESVLWADARRQADFDRAHVPGALALNEDEWDALLPALLERWTPDRRVVVYCDGGACKASQQVAARLRDAGIAPVYILRGGWPAWKAFHEQKP